MSSVDRAEVALAGGMAFLAGATDVYGLSRLHDLYVSFMSGNTTSLGKAIGDGDLARAATAAGLVGLFVAGAAFGAVLAEWAGKWRSVVVTGWVTLLLAWAALLPTLAIPPIVLAMGALNSAMSHVGQTSVSLTYVTGTLVKFGQGVGEWLCGKNRDWSWRLQGVMWLCLLSGAVVETWLQARLGAPIVWPLPIVAGSLTIAVFLKT
ncbi:MAG: DUF1275 domain-containing protein [Hyphomicrobiales bacterium]|nr:DUF1275 domain-containing protein [Hyphomicrobiales bacterium]